MKKNKSQIPVTKRVSDYKSEPASFSLKRALHAFVILTVVFGGLNFPLSVSKAVNPVPSNPPFGQSCGLDVALVLDSSGSIDSTELGQMKIAFKDFVDVFLPGTPTEFSVTDFDTAASVVSSFSSNATVVKAAVDSPASGGATNWQDGLIKAQSTFDPRPGVPNLVIFSSDGNPNRYDTNQGPGNGFDQEALDAAVVVANNIKTSGTRIITLGIGSDVIPANLHAISSADAYYSASNFSTLAATLHDLATDLCGGTITVTKLIDVDGNVQTTADQTPGAGWHFTIAGHADATDQSGKSLAWEVGAGSYNVTEAVDSGYTLVDASCTGATNNGSWSGTQISGIQVGDQDIVSCTFINSPNPGALTVTKQFSIPDDAGIQVEPTAFSFSVNSGAAVNFEDDLSNVVSVPSGAYGVTETNPGANWSIGYSTGCNGTMDPGSQALCTITNTYIPPDLTTVKIIKNVISDNGGTASNQDFGLTLDGGHVNSGQTTAVEPGNHTIGEAGLAGYSFVSITGAGCPIVLGGTVTLSEGQDLECTITNNDTAPSLTLTKVIDGGSASAGRWTLKAFLGDNPVPALSGAGGAHSAGDFQAGTYTLSESGDMTNYTAGGWSCQGGSQNGSAITLAIGEIATCSITNTYVPPIETCDGTTNLAGNGGFEAPVVSDQSNWYIFPSGTSGLNWSAAWTADDAETYNSESKPAIANVELQRGANGWTPLEGLQYTELDSDWQGPSSGLVGEPANVSLTQSIPTESNASYFLSFDYSPRPGHTDNQMQVSWDGSPVGAILAADGSGNSNTVWAHKQYIVTGTGNSLVLEFKEVGAPDSLGMFLDNVKLVRDCSGTPIGSISGQKFNDVNGNGAKDQGDSGLSGWTIYLDQNDNGVLDNGEVFKVSDESGNYIFSGLSAGTYIVREVMKSGWTQTQPGTGGDGFKYIQKMEGNNPTGSDFGNHQINADLGLTKTVSPASVTSGQQATFTLHVTNHGPDTATNVKVTDALPTGLTYVSSSSTVGSYATSTNEWIIGTLANGETATMDMITVVSGTAGQQIVNGASVSIDPNIDLNIENNSDSATVTVQSTGGGGCTSNCGGSSGGGGLPPGGIAPQPQQTTGQTSGTSTGTSLAMPTGEVLGASTAPELPRTGLPIGSLLLMLGVLAAIADKKFKLV